MYRFFFLLGIALKGKFSSERAVRVRTPVSVRVSAAYLTMPYDVIGVHVTFLPREANRSDWWGFPTEELPPGVIKELPPGVIKEPPGVMKELPGVMKGLPGVTKELPGCDKRTTRCDKGTTRV